MYIVVILVGGLIVWKFVLPANPEMGLKPGTSGTGNTPAPQGTPPQGLLPKTPAETFEQTLTKEIGSTARDLMKNVGSWMKGAT